MTKSITEKVLVQRLLLIINEGKREATYKLALLLALIDWCTTNSARNSPNRIHTSELAERVLALYWDHATHANSRQFHQCPYLVWHSRSDRMSLCLQDSRINHAI